MSLQVTFEIGHEASIRSKKTQEGFTHDWEISVRGVDGAEIRHYIDKVIFHLHETFTNPRRVLKSPPYSIKESGYAGFTLPIDIYFKNDREPKKIKLNYDLFLQDSGPPVLRAQRETQIFTNVSDEFRSRLLRGGAIQLNNYQEETKQSSEEKSQMMSKPKLSKTDLNKKPKLKTDNTMKNQDVFKTLFGTPLQKSESKMVSSESVKSKDSSKSYTNSKSEKSDKDKTKSKSPHKEKDRDKYRDKKDVDTDGKSREERKSKEKTKEKERSKDRSKKEHEKSPSRVRSPSPRRSPKPPSTPPPKEKKEKDNFKEKDRDKEKYRKEEKKNKKEKKEHKENKHKDKETERDHKSKENKDSSKIREVPKEKEMPTSNLSIIHNQPSQKSERKDKLKDKEQIREDEKVEKNEKNRSEKSEEKIKHKHKKKDKEKHKDKREEKSHKTERKIEKNNIAVKENGKGSAISSPPREIDKNSLFGSPKSDSAGDNKKKKVISKPLNSLMSSLIDDSSNSSKPSSREPSPVPEKNPQKSPDVVDSKKDIETKTPKDESPKKKDKKEKKKEKKADRDSEKKRKRKSDQSQLEEAPPEKLAVKEKAVCLNNNADIGKKVAATDNVQEIVKKEAEDYMNMLRELQHKIMGLKDNADLQKVVQLIAETGQFEVSANTFDFDLCLLDKTTVSRLQDFFRTV